MREPIFKTIELSSGFTIKVQPLPPYYVDFIEESYPLVEYPKRKVELASGDIIFVDYFPPNEEPNSSDGEEYELYVKWDIANKTNKKIDSSRERARRDFLLSTCVTIVDGPISVDDDAWVEEIATALPNYKVPDNPRKRMLAFLKARVLRVSAEFSKVVQECMFKEVTMQGLEDALRAFQDEMGQRGLVGSNKE